MLQNLPFCNIFGLRPAGPGGYQVIDKYLKSRKTRTLSLDEIGNITNICNVLAFTIEQMKRVDKIYEVAFS